MAAEYIKGSVAEICHRPVIYTRGYNEGAAASLYFYLSKVFRAYHTLLPQIDMRDIGAEWNRTNHDPADMFLKVIFRVCDEIMEEDRKAYERKEDAPHYEMPEEGFYVTNNLRYNDFIEVDTLLDLLDSFTKEVSDESEEV